jgi:hypothetical protein
MVLVSQRVRSLLAQQIDKRLIVSLRMKDLSTTITTIDDVVAVVPDYGLHPTRHPRTLVVHQTAKKCRTSLFLLSKLSDPACGTRGLQQ